MSNLAPLFVADEPSLGRERAIAAFRNGARTSSAWASLILVAAMVALALATGKGSSLGTVTLVVGALFVRDLGRWIGIHIVGYPDPELLILPFFRRALPAEGDRVEQWKRGVVILLGPLPGLAVAFVLAVVSSFGSSPELRNGIFVITVVNATMLIPLRSFDGGRLLNIVLFSRSRWLELVFSILTAAVLAIAAVRGSSVFWGLLAGFALINAHSRFQLAGAAAGVRADFPDLPRKPVKVPEQAVDMIFAAADRLAAPALRTQMHAGDVRAASLYAGRMLQIHETAVQLPPALLPSLLLLLAYGGGFVLATCSVVMTVLAGKGGAP
jgi:hypothetical protein